MTQILRKIRKNMIVALFLLLPAFVVFAGYSYCDCLSATHIARQMLLHSGQFDTRPAAVKYILWSKEEQALQVIEKKLKETGLVWHKNTLKNYAENKAAFQYSTMQTISKQEEKQALQKYFSLLKEFENLPVRIFFEERVDSNLNLDLYLKENKIEVKEKIRTPDTISITGYIAGLRPTIVAGPKTFNFQLLAKGQAVGSKEQTVLAIPALLEEF